MFWGCEVMFWGLNSSDSNPEQFWGWVLNPRMFWCSGVYGTPLMINMCGNLISLFKHDIKSEINKNKANFYQLYSILFKFNNYEFITLNSTIHGKELLYQTPPNHGKLQQDNASNCLRLCQLQIVLELIGKCKYSFFPGYNETISIV